MSLCEGSGKKLKGERYSIGRMVDVLAIFSISIKNGKEVGRRNSFFYNANKLVLSVSLEEYMSPSPEKMTISSVEQEDKIIRTIYLQFPSNPPCYETGVVDLIN